MNITITPKAEKFMRRIVRFGGGPADSGFRLTVTAGGCSGLASEFSSEAVPKAGDAILDWNGLKVFLPAESRLLLDGVTIDFVDTTLESGLSFINPNATSCGCSSSDGSSKPAMTAIDISAIKRA
ncbi:MAG: iron-sulfur cluster assembly accessory protein [Betaproteobacteria bacterium]|nr:iron-sulfur cluster assembly accessory protein [Betaproteobacteria bacterium]